MQQFFYEKNGEQKGPVTTQDLKPLMIMPNTLIWYKGLENWVEAKNVEFLSSYFKEVPPPLPNEKTQKPRPFSGFDSTYKKESDITIFGIVILTVSIGYYSFAGDPFGYKDSTSLALIVLVGFIVKVTATVVASSVATRQNRNSFIWGLFAFFIPSIALIILGTQNRKLEVGGLTMKELAAKDKKFKHFVIENQDDIF